MIKDMKEGHILSLLDSSDVAVYGGRVLERLCPRWQIKAPPQRWRGSFDWVVWPESGRNELDSSRGDGEETHTCWTVTVGSRFNEI